jgi:tetratricopeptide (TPR) repeat protein
MRPLLLVIAALGLAAQAAAADVPPAQQEAAISVLLAKGDAAGACALAAPLVVQRGDDLEAHFLYGQCLMGLHKPADAAQQYRFILSRNPNAMRVHAELAAAEAAMGDKNSAAAELKTILASNPPPQVRANLEQLLGGLSGSAAKTWTAQFSIGITDDTNVNAGPGAGIVTVFGAPFVLSGSSLRQQDWAATGNATVNYFHAFDDQLGFAATASQQLVEYNRVHGFDYSGTSLVAGPVWKGTGYELFSNVGTSVALLGGHLYSTSWGISPQLVLPIDDTVILNEQISLQRNDYYRDALRSGFSQTVSSSAQWFVGRPGGFVQPRVLFTYEGASIQVDRDQQFAVLL